MDAFADFFPQLLLVVALLGGALALSPLLERIALPGPAGFLAVGIAAGALGLGSVDELGPVRLQEIGAIALFGILFQGGLATGFSAWRRNARQIVALGLPGTATTAAGLAALGHYALGLEWGLAALVGVALAPTDPAAVYSLLRGGGDRSRPRTILEGESGFNDPVGISLAVVVVAYLGSDGTLSDGAWRLGLELGIGLVGGLVGAAALTILLRLTPRLEEGLQAVGMLIGAVFVGAVTASLHGSGFLAVYVAGLLLADRWAAQDGPAHAVPEAIAAGAEPILFGLLGAAFAPVVIGGDIWRGLALTIATVVVIRPVVVWLSLTGSALTRRERLLVNVGGLKGAVPLLLAAYPALEDLAEAERTQGIVLVATAASLVLQAWAVRWVARPEAPALHD